MSFTDYRDDSRDYGARDAAVVHAVSCFSVTAVAEANVMARVLGIFAKRGILPGQCYSTVCGARDEDLHIDLQVADLDQSLRERIAECLRQIVEVRTVLTSEKRRALSA